MKILIAAPGIAPPWTEGRKNFVRDLLPELHAQTQIHLLTTQVTTVASSKTRFPVPATVLPASNKAMQILLLHRHLAQLLPQINPDIVLHFPFGTFDGLRRWFNQYSLTAVHRIARRRQCPCLTILYSMTQGSLGQLTQKIPPLATAPTYNWHGLVVNPGINPEQFPLIPAPANNRTLLFMAGIQENSSRLLQNILFERGLIEIIEAGPQLAHHQFRLSIAIPLLRYPERRAELQSYLSRLAPALPVQMHTEVAPQQLLARHSIYLFPYRKNLRVFIPTSVVEAIAMGIPTLLSNLPMFTPLQDQNPPLCSFYEAENPAALVETALQMVHNWQAIRQQTAQAANHVRQFWSVHHAAQQILDILHSLS